MPDDVMQRARELLAKAYDARGDTTDARCVRNYNSTPHEEWIMSIIAAALTETQALRAEIARAREAVSLVGEIAQHGGVGGTPDHWADAARDIMP